MEILEDTTKLNALTVSLNENSRLPVPETFKTRSEDAKSALEKLEFPTTKQEYWKYTRTAKLGNKNWALQPSGNVKTLPEEVAHLENRMVFVNGHFSAEHSNLEAITGVKIKPFSKSTEVFISELEPYLDFAKTPFLALNTAFPQDGFTIRLSANTVIEEMINVVNIYSGNESLSQPRSVIYLEKGSKLNVTEYHFHENGGSTFANTSLQVKLEANSTLGIDCIEKGHSESFHLMEMEAVVERDTVFTHNVFTLSGSWTRNNGNTRVKGENSTVHLNGFYLPNGTEHVDNHTVVDHEAAHCDSNELYRGVILDRATAVFNGKVYVRPDAQKTNAYQSNGNILGSDDATVYSKPELEIYADDVKCSHGSTTGQLDEDALFYLMARGLSRINARNLLVEAFAGDVLKNVVNSEIRPIIEAAIAQKLSK